MSSIWLIATVSVIWAWVALNQALKHDWPGFAVSLGIVITNTGFAFQMR